MTTTEIQIRRLFAAFPEQRKTPETIAVYTERLETIDPALLERAISDVLDQTTDYLPRIGAIKQAAWKAVAPDNELAGMQWAIGQLNRVFGYTAAGASYASLTDASFANNSILQGTIVYQSA